DRKAKDARWEGTITGKQAGMINATVSDPQRVTTAFAESRRLQVHSDVARAPLIELRPIMNATRVVIPSAPHHDGRVPAWKRRDVPGWQPDDDRGRGHYHHRPRSRGHDDRARRRRDHHGGAGWGDPVDCAHSRVDNCGVERHAQYRQRCEDEEPIGCRVHGLPSFTSEAFTSSIAAMTIFSAPAGVSKTKVDSSSFA